MKKTLILIAVFCGIIIDSFSQITFIRHYGEFTGQGNSLIINSNSNYIIGGRKNQTSNFDQFCTYELNTWRHALAETLRNRFFRTSKSNNSNN